MSYEWNMGTVAATAPIGFSIQNATVGLDINADWLSETGRNPADLAELMGQIKDACEAAGLTVGGIHARASADATLEEI